MNPIQTLIDLQEVDGRIRELEREAKDLPMRKAQESARLKGVNASLEIARSQLGVAQQRVKDAEGEAAAAKERVKELKILQASASSNKEYQQLSMAIEGLEREAEEAEARGYAMMDELPRLERGVKEAEEAVSGESGGVDEFCRELDERLAAVKEELDRLAVERTEKAKLVNPRTLLYYERLRTKRWPVAVTLNSDCVCEGCHLKVPPSTEQMVDHKMELVACTNCGRMLYRDL
ncbi:MAG: C4-type zinc ribbon domain-containing protein [Verrucomicrobiota bacterium]|nr:C4-type zinc ribbon domain-containing protein [Verrucomicrobiota bacterium]MDY5597740.1 C4-type zinc ribbon domain-containing protein [Kiritimatiellia bacterium]